LATGAPELRAAPAQGESSRCASYRSGGACPAKGRLNSSVSAQANEISSWAPSAIWRRINHTNDAKTSQVAVSGSGCSFLGFEFGPRRATSGGMFDWPVFLVSISTYQNLWHFDPALISSFYAEWVSASCGSPPRYHSCRWELHRTPWRIK